jgi:hypothetical protein
MKFPFPPRPVSFDAIPLEGTDFPIRQFMDIGFDPCRCDTLVAVMKIVRQFPQRRTGLNLLRVRQSALGEFNRIGLRPFRLFDRSDF